MASPWRTLCARCDALARDPLEAEPLSLGSMIVGTGRLVWKSLPLGVPLATLLALPRVAVGWETSPPIAFELAYSILIHSFGECLLLAWTAELVLCGRTSLGSALSRVKRGYLSVVAVNLILNLLVTAGMVAFWIPALLVATWFMAAIPIALFEGAGPLAAMKASFVRTRGHRLAVFALATVTMVIVLSISEIRPIWAEAHQLLTRTPLPPEHARSLQAATTVLHRLDALITQLLQLVVFIQTRPPTPITTPRG